MCLYTPYDVTTMLILTALARNKFVIKPLRASPVLSQLIYN